MTILIVEDNPRFAAFVAKVLKKGIPSITRVLYCEDGPDAIKLHAQHKPDWILMDIELRKLDGLSASREIRGIDPEARIVIMTQHSQDVYRRAALEVGARGFVLKENLSQAVQVILDEPQSPQLHSN